MTADRRKAAVALALALAFIVAPAAAATKEASTSFLPGASSKQPVSIEADKLVYFDKEQRAVYTGNVVVIQGDSKMTCSGLTIFLEKAGAPDAAPAQQAVYCCSNVMVIGAGAKKTDQISGRFICHRQILHLGHRFHLSQGRWKI